MTEAFVVFFIAYILIGREVSAFHFHVTDIVGIDVPSSVFSWILWPLYLIDGDLSTCYSSSHDPYLSCVRAKALFFSLLTTGEKIEYVKNKRILIVNKSKGAGLTHGIFIIDHGQFIRMYPLECLTFSWKENIELYSQFKQICVQFSEQMPMFDRLAMRVALLKVDPDYFFSKANIKKSSSPMWEILDGNIQDFPVPQRLANDMIVFPHDEVIHECF